MSTLSQELDRWALDIEKTLMHGDYVSRGRLQRTLMKLEPMVDKYHNLYLEHKDKYDNHIVMKHCMERAYPEFCGLGGTDKGRTR
jgi:hypothetical protein